MVTSTRCRTSTAEVLSFARPAACTTAGQTVTITAVEPDWAASTLPRDGGRRWRRPAGTRRLLVSALIVLLTVSLVAVLVGSSAANAAPTAPTAVTTLVPTTAPPSMAPSEPRLLPTFVTCLPGLSEPTCVTPSRTAPPCVGEGCIPQPTTTAAPPSGPGPGLPRDGDGSDSAHCGITHIGGCFTNAINDFFRSIVTAALNPLLSLLAKTLLTTPSPNSLPRVEQLWNTSWQILLASYSLLIVFAGVLIMGYESVQTRYTIKEVAPRIVVGFLAGALSLWVATKGIEVANGLAQAVMGGGISAAAAGQALKILVLASLGGGIFIVFIGIVLAGMLTVLLVTYVVRVALAILLIAGAPLALMFHALPQTEGIAKWWWKAYAGVLAIQVVQSLTLITAMRVFLAPGGFTLFGPTPSGLVNLLVTLALVYILFKIPFWILGSIRGSGGGRSLAGSLARGFIAYKTFGLLRGHDGPGGRGSGPGRGGGPERGPRPPDGGGPPDPYARPRTDATGQYLLPLSGVRRTRPPGTPRPAPAPGTVPGSRRRGGRGRQLSFPADGQWPENRPVLQRDGQYRLPIHVQRVTPTRPPDGPDPARAGRGRRGHGRQLELPLDPYQGNRPDRSGQYPLPLDGLRRTPRPASPPPAPASPPPPPPRRSRRRGTQLEIPFDPYKGNRPDRAGQYPLPLDGVRRTPSTAAPAPVTPPARPTRPAGRQLRLPLDLPAPARRTPPRRIPPPPAPPRPRNSGGRS